MGERGGGGKSILLYIYMYIQASYSVKLRPLTLPLLSLTHRDSKSLAVANGNISTKVAWGCEHCQS